MSKTVQIISRLFFSLLAVLIIYRILSPIYDAEATKVAIGQTYDLSDGWTVELENEDRLENISLPYTIPSYMGDTILLYHDIHEEYSGLALNFLAKNSALRIFVEGKPIFEAGYTDDSISFEPDNTDNNVENNIPNNMEDNLDDQNEPLFIDTVSKTEDAGEVTADLPSTTTDGTMRIQLDRVGDDDIFIQYATVCKRDVAVINVLRDSMFPILCGLLVLFACVIDLVLDAVRFISGERMRGLIVVALMGVLSVLFMILQTDLMKMFFSNKLFFSKIAMLIIAVIPALVAWFYELGFQIYYPLQTRIMVAVTTIATFLILGLESISIITSKSILKPLTLLLYLFLFVNVLSILFRQRKLSSVYHIVRYDLLSITCLAFALILVFQGDISDHSQAVEYIIDIFITLTNYFILAQHVSIVMFNYRQKLERNSKKLERQVEIANSARLDAIAANEAKGNFLANMSHEIRTPINAVLGMDEMILRESREKTIREYAMDIHTAGQSLLSIINDILDLSKIDSGKMEIIPVDYDISSMIHDLSNMISLRAKAKNLKFEVTVDSEIPAKFHGDDVRIKQVLTNILTNAVKYTESGNVWFRITGTRMENQEKLHFEIEDTGIGIKEDDMSKLFEAFQRIEENRNRNIEGTGLGMNITLKMLELMGSKLQVESKYGEGSKFYFDLVQEVVDDTPIGDFNERIKKLGQQYVYTRSFIAPEAKILVVDDNAMNRKVFSALLKPTQINVEEAESGLDAIAKAQSQYYDIIFMDHIMPQMDGIEAMHRIIF